MANDTSETSGFDKKWGLAGLLAAILAGVVYFQFSGSGAATPRPQGPRGAIVAAAPPVPAPTSGTSLNPTANATPAPAPAEPHAWPQFPRVEVEAYNPFAWPPTRMALAGSGGASGSGTAANSTQPAKFTSSNTASSAETLGDDTAPGEERRVEHRRERRQVLANLQRDGVAAVLLKSDKSLALVGGRQVQVGDVIEGFEVKQISRDGVVLVDQSSETAQ